MIIFPARCIHGMPLIPGDKSISHRALLLGALAQGTTEISGLLKGEDVLSTWRCLNQLGISITETRSGILVRGKTLKKPSVPLDCGNSGTTMRLLSGVLSGCPFSSQLVGDASLSRRPMSRVTQPLGLMGAQFELTRQQYAPFWVHGSGNLKGISYSLPVASAQVKSALLLAGLSAQGETILSGKISSRDHTERLLCYFGVTLGALDSSGENSAPYLSIQGGQQLEGKPIRVPGDISSAAYWIVAATLLPGSDLEMNQVSLNPTRMGIIKVLQRMGAQIEFEITQNAPEPMGRMRVRHAALQGTTLRAEEIPELIDELPLLAVAASFAEGVTHVSDAAELRLKETDRIAALAKNLTRMGGQIETFPDGFSVRGVHRLQGAVIDPENDHRIAMAFSIAALKASGSTEIQQPECVSISYPDFYKTLEQLTREI